MNNNAIKHAISADKLEKILNLGKTLQDKSGVGMMKDFYVLDLFNFKNINILLEKDLIYELLYIIPFTFWAEACTNTKISRSTRIELLNVSFEILYSFF